MFPHRLSASPLQQCYTLPCFTVICLFDLHNILSHHFLFLPFSQITSSDVYAPTDIFCALNMYPPKMVQNITVTKCMARWKVRESGKKTVPPKIPQENCSESAIFPQYNDGHRQHNNKETYQLVLPYS